MSFLVRGPGDVPVAFVESILDLKDKALELVSSLTCQQKIRLLNGEGSWYTFTADKKIPRLTMSDGPHGLRVQNENESYANINESKKATCFPSASCIASSWNTKTVYKEAYAIAQEAKVHQVNIVLGCGMNIKRSPLCGRNFEYFSEDPYLTGKLAASYVKGMQSANVAACIKHFACNNQETNRQSSSSIVDERTLREIYVRAFEIAVTEAHPFSVMSSYNMINGIYASQNKHLLKDLLRHTFNFEGIVISDWGADINSPESVKAGLDLAMPDSKGYFQKKLSDALDSNAIEQKDIDEACLRLVTAALLASEKKEHNKVSISYEEQNHTAFSLALDSAVLLKNDGLLPLRIEDTKQRLIVIGSLAKNPRFQGGGSSHINATFTSSILDELEKLYSVIYADGYLTDFTSEKKRAKKNVPLQKKALALLDKALKQNADTPVLFVCGLTDAFEGEGFDRTDMLLPQEQLSLYEEIAKRTKHILVVNISGSPVDLSFAQNARSILQLYLAGQASAIACAYLISGKANPSGHLAETWPCLSNLAPSTFISKEKNILYTEGPLVGYRYYETKKLPVQYEFGFGLSYTSFELSDFVVIQKNEKIMVTVQIKNTGSLYGAQVVQVYVKNPQVALYERSAIELVAFDKVYLEPGEEKKLVLVLDEHVFCVFSSKKNSFAKVAGTYTLACGFSVRDLRCKKEIAVEGEALENLVESESERLQELKRLQVQTTKTLLTSSDSMQRLSKYSFFARTLLRFMELYIVVSSKSKNKEDPAVKVALQAIRENPVESLISTSGGAISPSLVQRLVAHANKKRYLKKGHFFSII